MRRHETSVFLPPFGDRYDALTCAATVRVRFPECMDRDLVIGFIRVRRTK
jgi:hypothetical protein